MAQLIHFWDMDHTIINNDCDVSWKEFMIQKGLCGDEARKKADFFYEQYLNQCLDVDQFLRFQLDEFKGKTPEFMRQLCAEHCEALVLAKVYKDAKRMIEAQKSRGELVCLLTATNRYIAEPVATLFGIEHILATELELENGVFTGSHAGTYCCGAGKLVHMQSFLLEHKGSLERSSYFGDSTNDIPILEKVGFPYATNPSAKLRETAIAQNWSILDFK
jgi:HAD superfamily hydrolase (TIGR01490 family)